MHQSDSIGFIESDQSSTVARDQCFVLLYVRVSAEML
jgi:hypothetical protein